MLIEFLLKMISLVGVLFFFGVENWKILASFKDEND
jgi:hypothetical protein